MEYIALGGGMIGVRDELAKSGPYEVGRWARGGPAPDRCYWCSLADIKLAVGVVSVRDADKSHSAIDDSGESETCLEGGVLWSYGYCQEHEQEAQKWAEGGRA